MKGKSRLELVRAAGMMSTPSLDGVKLAVVETDGVKIRKFGETRYRAYSEAERGLLRRNGDMWSCEHRHHDRISQDILFYVSDTEICGPHCVF